MRVTTSPLRSAGGEVIGGVETFRDITHEYRDLERAQRAQMLALTHPEVRDPRITLRDRYVPRDVVGGDFHAMAQVEQDKVAFWIGDVMGHGIAAALYTMQLRCLWGEFSELMDHPEAFVYAVNERLIELKGADESFATVMFGLFDLSKHEATLVSAGGPPPVHLRADGTREPELPLSGIPLGVVAGMPFDAMSLQTSPGDTMLFFTDGATEFDRPGDGPLGRDGLLGVLTALGYPGAEIALDDIEQALLSASGSVRLPDDVTLLEVRLARA
jgi:serine phosphatase RsbU (regulator of sigma subunit)